MDKFNESVLDIKALELEIASVEANALDEEKVNARNAYDVLNNQLRTIEKQIPYPNTEPYTKAVDYEDNQRVQWEKSLNKPYWDKCNQLRAYSENGRLYCGHLYDSSTGEYYIMDSTLESRILEKGRKIRLINADDKKFADIVKSWRYPDQNRKIVLSRIIDMRNKEVTAVEVLLDNNSSMFATITDAYLRKALIRNKERASSDPGNNMQSIIQTIQEKQDRIRSLDCSESFIVQGCAGSGKTMVLLHRLRYLLFNKEIEKDGFVLLVPSLRFKQFIKNISIDFRISEKNIFSFQSYYQSLCGKGGEIIEDAADELVFGHEFLSRVYSKELIADVYQSFFDDVMKQVGEALRYSENRLNTIVNIEEELVRKEIDHIAEECVLACQNELGRLTEHLSNKIERMEDISEVIGELGNIYEKNKADQESFSDNNTEITITSEDERLLSNSILQGLLKELDNEKEVLKSASIFTAKAHENKLLKIQEQYDKEYAKAVQEIIEEEKKKRAEKVASRRFVFDGITLDDIGFMLENVAEIYETSKAKLIEENHKKNNINEFIAEKYKDGIAALNELIELSSTIREKSKEFVLELTPSYDFLASIMRLGTVLLKTFAEDSDEDKKRRAKLRYFSDRTDSQARAFINARLFNWCKKIIKKEYDITINKMYKHYWYMQLYCQYLTNYQNFKRHEYIFVDEGQDLSKAEIDLINKLNFDENGTGPVFNIFGDVNQTIAAHGIHDWNEIEFIHKIYYLDENFRNPNQIIDYCNNMLPFNMKKVGVDMEPVRKYKKLSAAMHVSDRKKNAVYIVKDEYAKNDLTIELQSKRLSGRIYTVKEAKGLEFREAIVLDRDMTDNEKYIAFTRALKQLVIVKDLAQHTDRNEKLYVQGAEDDSNGIIII